MKKIVIVNNNMLVGGVQKSLYNLLWSIDTANQYDVTLVLFSKTGEYIDKLPENIKIVECKGPFRYLGKSQGEFRNSMIHTLIRGLLVVISRIFGSKTAFRLMILFEPELEGSYDCAVSFFCNGRKKSFYGGAADYVLGCIKANKKVTVLHGDYRNCGANNPQNNATMKKFDMIAACSDGCRASLEACLPDLKSKCMTLKNCHRFDEILNLASQTPIEYNSSELNIVTVSRLSREKGIDRALRAIATVKAKGIPVKFHIVGGGSIYNSLKETASDLGLEENVFFYKEQANPYRFMKNADLFLLSSYHEAAPMVIDEARCLGIPVLTTSTTSSEEMVTAHQCGWVCDNDDDALCDMLLKVAQDKASLTALKKKLLNETSDNRQALAQFETMVK